MYIIRPPFTGNAEIDSWTNQITQALNMGLLLPGVQGQSGEGGAAGPSGNTAIYLYQRTTDNTAPSRPTSVVYDYTDIENVTITANNGWLGAVPTSGGNYLWVTFRYVSNIQDTITNANTWNTVVLLSEDGASITEVSIYRKNSNTFSTGGSYNFVTQTLTPPTDWLITAPSLSSNDDVIYRISGVASGAATQTAATVNYGSPVIYARRTDGTNGTDGTPADVLRNVYLYDSSVSAPSTPTSTQGFNSTTGNAADTGTWTTTVPSIGTGHALWITTSILTQTEGTGSFTSGGWTVYQASGYDGDAGPAAPRFVSRRVYASSSTGTPSAPSATLTWSTLALSGITAGWSETAPTAIATSTTLVYFSDFLFIDVTGIATTSSDTGSTPKEGISFSGIVTFNSGDFATVGPGGGTITSIDGSNIATGTIAANQINADAITGKNITVGTLTDTAIPTGTKEGVRIASDGTMVVGDINNYLRWDGEKLIVQGGIINFQEKFFRGQGKSDYATITTDTDNLVSTGVVSTGWNAFGLVAGGGGSTGSRRSENNGFASSGGGGGATIQFGLFVDENDIINVDVGSGGSLGTTFSSQAGAGGDTTFTLIRNSVTYVITAGGGGGGRGNSYSLTSGGAGGVMSFTKDGVIQTLGQMQALGIFHSLSGQNGGKGGDTPNTGSNSQGRGGGGGGGVDIYLTKNIANISSTYVDGKIGNSTVGATAYGGSIWGLATGYATSNLPASGNQTTAGTVPAGLVIYNSPLIDSTPNSNPGNFMGAAGAPRPSGTTSSSGNSGGTPGGGAGGASASWNSHNASSNSNGGNGGVGIIYYVAL